MNSIVDLHIIAAVLLFVITFFILFSSIVVLLVLIVKFFTKKKLISILLSILLIIPTIFLHELCIFGVYYKGENYISQKKYDTAIKTFNIGTKWTLNSKQKALFHGEIGNTYLLMAKQGFNVILAYNAAFLQTQSYKMMKNKEIWSPLICKMFIKKNQNNVASNWPLLAAKTYTYENHFEWAEKIYLTTEKEPLYSELITTSILKNKYDKAIEYADLAIAKAPSPTLYAKRANLHKLRADIDRYKNDKENAIALCKNDRSCISRSENLTKTFAYNTFQNYYNQRKMLGFEKF